MRRRRPDPEVIIKTKLGVFASLPLEVITEVRAFLAMLILSNRT